MYTTVGFVSLLFDVLCIMTLVISRAPCSLAYNDEFWWCCGNLLPEWKLFCFLIVNYYAKS